MPGRAEFARHRLLDQASSERIQIDVDQAGQYATGVNHCHIVVATLPHVTAGTRLEVQAAGEAFLHRLEHRTGVHQLCPHHRQLSSCQWWTDRRHRW